MAADIRMRVRRPGREHETLGETVEMVLRIDAGPVIRNSFGIERGGRDALELELDSKVPRTRRLRVHKGLIHSRLEAREERIIADVGQHPNGEHARPVRRFAERQSGDHVELGKPLFELEA